MERRAEGKNGFMGCVCGFFAFYVRVFVFCGVFFGGDLCVGVCVCITNTQMYRLTQIINGLEVFR